MTSFWSIDKRINNNKASRNIDQELEDDFLITCIYFAQLAYFQPQRIYSKLQGLNPLHVSIYCREGTQCFFAEFDTFAIVSFKGSEDNRWKNFTTDFKFWNTRWQGHTVHTGFLNALHHIRNRIGCDIAEMPQGKRLIYTGHSLGGALSLLLAFEHKPTDICTFGSPRAIKGNEAVDYFSDISVTRVTVENDFVPELPPKFIGYNDVGHHILYSKRSSSKWQSHKLSTYLRAVLSGN